MRYRLLFEVAQVVDTCRHALGRTTEPSAPLFPGQRRGAAVYRLFSGPQPRKRRAEAPKLAACIVAGFSGLLAEAPFDGVQPVSESADLLLEIAEGGKIR